MKLKTVILYAAISVAVVAVIYIIRKKCENHSSTSENFDPQDMGSRNFWGFGREYGYPNWDLDFSTQVCYQVTPRFLCRPGYSRKINPSTGGSECCRDRYVYE